MDPTEDGGAPALGAAVDAEGFCDFLPGTTGRFLDSFGTIRVRAEGARARCRVATGRGQSNISDNIHGGFILGFVDQILFCGPLALDRLLGSAAVTLNASVNFIGAARPGRPLDGLVEIVAETGRMMFLRGLIEQDGVTVASFDGTLRKMKVAIVR